MQGYAFQALTSLLSVESSVEFCSAVIEEAIERRVSDIHFEPFDGFFRIRFRKDGDLAPVFRGDIKYYDAVLGRLKYLTHADRVQKILPSDGRFTFEGKKHTVDIRGATMPTIYGEKVALRILDARAYVRTREELGMTSEVSAAFSKILAKEHGLFLLSGITGSGKTTTLYTLIRELSQKPINILTIEDPVEYKIEGITQVAVNEKVGLVFDTVLKSFLRQDPDVIMVGEIRDTETARLAIRAALTGHLILATIHTKDAISAITRLRDLGIEDYLIASSLIGVASQRLVRVLCPRCKEKHEPDEVEKMIFERYQFETDLYHPTGCKECFGGYDGRTGVFEVFPMDATTREMIASGKSEDEIRRAQRGKLPTMMENAIRLLSRGETTIAEVMRKIENEILPDA